MAQFPPIIKGLDAFVHGGDYNPEQWLKDKDTVWPRDMELAKKAGINSLSVGIFSWAVLEPKEGEYHFEWLDEVMDLLAKNGMKAVLATPTAARPAWMAEKYPEVLRVTPDRLRRLYGERHNQCLASPVYREKAQQINTLLAQRYANHPALGAWHINNEYGGECHCENCQKAFRKWLKERYGTIENLNDLWWNSFWSHRYSDFDQIESPSPIGENTNPALTLAWKRFVSWQYIDFYKHEIAPLKRITPDVPCTTNLMPAAPTIDYYALAKEMDFISWDSYPSWCSDERDAEIAGVYMSFWHDAMRCMGGGKPYFLMESSPSATNWQPVNRLRRPGILELQGLHAVAHGSDSVQYFQFRAGRGGFEKYHGAVVTHDGREDNRIYREVCKVGERLKALQAVRGSAPENKIAVIYDWENAWILGEEAFGVKNKGYEAAVIDHYAALQRLGYGLDVIDQTCPLDGYRVVCGPMTYMLRPGFADRVKAFVAGGGTYIATYCSGLVDNNILCYLGGFPGELREVAGIWNEETDALDETQRGSIHWNGGTYEVHDFAAIVHPESAEVEAVYGNRFYEGTPALTVNRYGKGRCYYIAARTGRDFLCDLYRDITVEVGLKPLLENLPEGVVVTERIGSKRYLFVENFSCKPQPVHLPAGTLADSGTSVSGTVTLKPYSAVVLVPDNE